MATTHSEITDIIEYLKSDHSIHTPIREIDGVKCSAELRSFNCKRCPTPDGGVEGACIKIRIDISADYNHLPLFHKCFDKDATHEQIVAFIKTIPDLKFCKTIGQFCHDPAESKLYYERKFMEEIFNSVDEVVNYKTDYGECPVCLDVCYTMLGCNHHLCLQCESKMTDKKCPQCRAAYPCHYYQSDGDY